MLGPIRISKRIALSGVIVAGLVAGAASVVYRESIRNRRYDQLRHRLRNEVRRINKDSPLLVLDSQLRALESDFNHGSHRVLTDLHREARDIYQKLEHIDNLYAVECRYRNLLSRYAVSLMREEGVRPLTP